MLERLLVALGRRALEEREALAQVDVGACKVGQVGEVRERRVEPRELRRREVKTTR